MAGRNEFYDDDKSFIADPFGCNVGKTQLPPDEDRYTRTVPVEEPEVPTIPMSEVGLGGKTEISDVIEVNGKTVAQTVGWLVCIKGESKGVDYHLHSGFNYIGRSAEVDISIKDPQVSGKMVSVAYDNEMKAFTLMRCEGIANIPRCNGAPVYTPIELKIYDVITLGKTQLMFVPLCGEKFSWEVEEE